jgi:hypothetical protein
MLINPRIPTGMTQADTMGIDRRREQHFLDNEQHFLDKLNSSPVKSDAAICALECTAPLSGADVPDGHLHRCPGCPTNTSHHPQELPV